MPEQTQAGPTAGGRGAGGRGAGLSRDRVLAAAVELMDRNGVEWLTMRRLAAHLGVQPGALYWHFENKDALCRAAVERLAGDQHLDAALEHDATGPAREQLESHLRALRAHWRAHASVLALSSRFPPTTGGEVTERGIALVARFTGGGTDGGTDGDATEQYRALVWTVLGFVLAEDAVRASAHHTPVATRPGLYDVDLGTGGAPSQLDTEALFTRVLTLALDGLAANA